MSMNHNNLTLNGGKLSLCLSNSLINSNAFSPNIVYRKENTQFDLKKNISSFFSSKIERNQARKKETNKQLECTR